MRIDKMMDTQQEQKCPICGEAVNYSERYPRYLCRKCAGRVTDKDGRRVVFHNIDPMGHGCGGKYADTGELYPSAICYADGHECWADEARFGGIVIQAK